MVKMTPEERDYIVEILGQEALTWDICEFQCRLTAYMMETGFDKDWEITDYGRKIERLYDSIHYQNLDEEP